tara:strand:- start:145 stop:816 length:672 start_codon:yes stop_codon:yes gene_type:complete
MTAFQTQKIDSKTLSEKLNQARLSLNLSLETAAQKSKISIKYLKYLEQGKFNLLPEDVYVKGFLKEYAKVLNVPAKILVKLFNKEKNVQKALGQIPRSNFFKNKKFLQNFKITPKIFSIIFISILIIFFLIYLGLQIHKFSSVPDLILNHPEKDLTIFEDHIIIKGKISKDARLFLNKQEIETNEQGDFTQEINLQLGENDLEFISENRLGKKNIINRKIIVR